MLPMAKALLHRAHRAFASQVSTIIAYLLIMTLVSMIFLVEIASQAIPRLD
jgi:hypothetical protein